MAISTRTQQILATVLSDNLAAAEIVSADEGLPATPSFTTLTTTGAITSGGNVGITGTVTASSDAVIGGNVLIASGKAVKINSIQVVGAQQAAPANVAVTFTASAPSNYASPTGSLTIANGGTPTVVELVEYCDELRGVIANILAVLHAHGLTT